MTARNWNKMSQVPNKFSIDKTSLLRLICVVPVILIYCYVATILFKEPLMYLGFTIIGLLVSFFAMKTSWGEKPEYLAVAGIFIVISLAVFIMR
jgi:hypothetical protein